MHIALIIIINNILSLQITAKSIDYESLKMDELIQLHDTKQYPPRIKMTIEMTTDNFVLQVKFTGCEHLNHELLFPLYTKSELILLF